MGMKMKALAVCGLISISAAAAAEPVAGISGNLGDELFYNYVEAYYTHAYLGGSNGRVFADQTYGGGFSVFLADPIYLIANYDSKEFRFTDSSTTPPQKISFNAQHTTAGLGVHLPVWYATDLFANVTFERELDHQRTTAGGVLVPAGTGTLDSDGLGYEGGVRSFVSNFAEISISYKHQDLRDKRPDATGHKEKFTDNRAIFGAVVPVYRLLSLFARAEIGRNHDESGNKTDIENYILGARLNFRL